MNLQTRLGRITVERVDTALDAVVARMGAGHVDRTAFFFNPWSGKPGCLVGQILIELGVTQREAMDMHFASTSQLINKVEFNIEPAAAVYLAMLQTHNDRSRPWGAAREAAWAEVERTYKEWDGATPECRCGGCHTHRSFWGRLMHGFATGPAPTRTHAPLPPRDVSGREVVRVEFTDDQIDWHWNNLVKGLTIGAGVLAGAAVLALTGS